MAIYLAMICFGFGLWIAAVALFVNPRLRNEWLGPQRRRAVPWTGAEVLAIVLMTFVIFDMIVMPALITGSRLLDWVYGPGATDQFTNEKNGLWRERHGLWTTIIAFPVRIAIFVLVPFFISGTRPYQLGLTTSHWKRNLLAGIVGFVAITPMIYGVMVGATYLLRSVLHQPPDHHPLEQLVKHSPGRLDWILVLFTALGAAPLCEELFFRGLLQGWLRKRSRGAEAACCLAVAIALLAKADLLNKHFNARDWHEFILDLQPAMFVVSALPLLYMGRLFWKDQTWGAIYGSSLLFAIMHAFAWPTPIPLFVLGLGLGWLAFRTQSLAGPIVVHSLFNLVGCLQMAF